MRVASGGDFQPVAGDLPWAVSREVTCHATQVNRTGPRDGARSRWLSRLEQTDPGHIHPLLPELTTQCKVLQGLTDGESAKIDAI